MNDEKKDLEFDCESKSTFQGIKDKSMGLVANISERVEIWSKIIRVRVKISGLKKEIEENMKKVGAYVFRAFSNQQADQQVEIKEEMRRHLQRIRALNQEIEELEEMIKLLEEKRQQMIQHSQVKVEAKQDAESEKETSDFQDRSEAEKQDEEKP